MPNPSRFSNGHFVLYFFAENLPCTALFASFCFPPLHASPSVNLYSSRLTCRTPYYYREMYLPQLTTGPERRGLGRPDSKSLVYSMAGSLWRQEVGSPSAEQLTAGPGYDYQPDWSSDGRWIVFARYDHDAVELWSLDLRDGRAAANDLERRG